MAQLIGRSSNSNQVMFVLAMFSSPKITQITFVTSTP